MTDEKKPKELVTGAEKNDATDEVNKKRVVAGKKALDQKLTEAESEAFYDHSSHRAMAIVLSAIIENHLTELLRLLMRRDKKIADDLFKPIGPIGSFGIKIRLAYMLRIISKESYDDLIIVSKIRNKFAHDLAVTSFEEQQIAGWIRNMKIYGIVKKMSEEAAERLKNKTATSPEERTKDFISSGFMSSMANAYRQCLRFLIHHIADYEMAIKLHEEELNLRAHKE